MRRAIAIAVLAACRVGPDYAPPATPDVASSYAPQPAAPTTPADGHAQRFTPNAQIAADWWRLFGSRELDAIVTACLAHNPALDAARASKRHAEDSLRASYGALLPGLDAHAGASYERATPSAEGLSLSPITFGLYTLSGTVSYALDLWGGQRRQIESLAAGVDSATAALAGARVTLIASATDAAIARALYAAEIATTRDSVALEREQLRITQAQAQGGTIPYSDVLAIESQIAATEATIPALEQKIDQADHLIAALAGEPPTYVAPPLALDALALPTELPVSLPANLVRQRPDVLVAEATLHAATAQIGVATAAMLPSLTLQGTLGGNNSSIGSLFASNSIFGGIAGGITAPLFHGGALYYERRAAIDARDQALATYRQIVLAAFEQVADSLRGLTHDADVLGSQKHALDAAQQELDLIQANFRAGLASYLQVIVANEQLLQARLGYAQAIAARLQDTVALYVALGGGWWNAPL